MGARRALDLLLGTLLLVCWAAVPLPAAAAEHPQTRIEAHEVW
jgi:hypothetical protein